MSEKMKERVAEELEEQLEEQWNYLAHVYAVDVDDEEALVEWSGKFPEDYLSEDFQRRLSEYRELQNGGK